MDKLKLLEITYNKVAQDADFIAYYFRQIMESGISDRQQLLSSLQCSEENFYKLGLSKLPPVHQPDYAERINRIATFAGTPPGNLKDILVKALLLQKAKEQAEQQTLEHILFAGWQNSGNKLIRQLYQSSQKAEGYLSAMTKGIPRNMYRGGFAVIAFIFSFMFFNTGVDEKNFYASGHNDFKDSTSHLAIQDNTFTFPIQPDTARKTTDPLTSESGNYTNAV